VCVWTYGCKKEIPGPELTAAILLTFCRKSIHETGTITDNALDLFASDIFLAYTFSKKKNGGCVKNHHFRLEPIFCTKYEVTTLYLFNKKGKFVPVLN
jgi:hypothetical protein